MKSDIVDIDCHVSARTEKAALIHVGERSKAVWLPLSQIELEFDGLGLNCVTLPEWLALEKGLI